MKGSRYAGTEGGKLIFGSSIALACVPVSVWALGYNLGVVVVGLMISLSLPIGGLVHTYQHQETLTDVQQRFEQTTGTVLRAGMQESDPGAPKSRYILEPDIEVEYTRGDDSSEYTTETVFPRHTEFIFTPDGVQELLSDYEVGAETDVYVHPDIPRRAYIEPLPDLSMVEKRQRQYWALIVFQCPVGVWLVWSLFF